MTATLHGPVFDAARRAPSATAVACGEERLTYGELAARAAGLAVRLRVAGVGAEDVVAVCLPRGVLLPVALLGVLRAGGAFLPISADLPLGRALRIVADAGVRTVVADARTAQRFEGFSVVDVNGPEDGERPVPAGGSAGGGLGAAYVIYTSGSTGRPKGVVVPHAAAAAHVRAMTARLRTGPRDTVLQMAGESVDVAVEQLFTALSTGAGVLMRGPHPWGTGELRRALAGSGVTVADVPAALFAELMAERRPLRLGALRLLLVGGEQLPVQAACHWHERVGAAAGPGGPPVLLNAYGPTEAVITASVHEVTPAAGERVPIGRRVGARRLAVLDAELRRVRSGGPGELFIGGDLLARGYLNRPGLTAERFVPDPFGPPGARMYRSGDRVVRREPYGLEFLGRADEQVKIHGHRVEPGEVETVLSGHPLVERCCVVAGTERLVAHLVPADPGRPPAVGELRSWLAERLPPWMIPGGWHLHEQLPVTEAGKVDRAALPYAPMELVTEGEPRTRLERELVRIWREVLGLPRVGVHDDFFQLGGTSIGGIRVLAALREATGVELELRDVFAATTIGGLAALAGSVAAAGYGPRGALPPLTPAGRGPRTAPLSLMQEQIWFLEQLEPGNIAYNAPTTFRLSGPLDHARLEEAVTRLVDRHEVLRTTIETGDGGTPLQRVHAPYRVRVPLTEVVEDEVEALVLAEARVPFDVSRLPLVRWKLLRLAPDLHELVLVEHHLVHDGWSFALLVRDLAAFYKGQGPTAEPDLQYADVAWWQGEAAEFLSGQRAYWTERLHGADDGLDLPYDHPRVPAPAFAGAAHRVELPVELCERARAHSRAEGVTIFTTLLAAYVALLHRVGGQRDLCVGSAFANRRVPGTENVLGMFVNPVTLRFDLAGDPSFERLLGQAAEVALGAQAHQELPFTRVVEALAPARTPGRNPLFAAMFNMDDAPLGPIDLGDVRGSYLERHNRTAKVDLSVLAVPRAERQTGLPEDRRDRGITLIWEYRSDLFEAATVARLARQYEALLDAALAEPSVPVSELAAGQGERVGSAREQAATPVQVLFERHASATPDLPAVRLAGGGEVSYGELNRRANRISRVLRGLGVGPEDVVGLCLERDLDMPACVLGVLKAGAAYLPLDPAGPRDRLSRSVAGAGARVILTSARHRAATEALGGGGPGSPVVVAVDELPGDGFPEGDSPVLASAGNAAYLITTSGSTGEPKRVVITHGGLAAEYRAWEEAYRLRPGAHAQLAAFAFDVCTGDLVRALASGGTLVICPRETVLDPEALHRELREHDVRYAELLPSIARLLAGHCAAAGETLSFLRLIAVGGEPWTAEEHAVLRAVTGPRTRILNVYGVTEATVGSTSCEFEPPEETVGSTSCEFEPPEPPEADAHGSVAGEVAAFESWRSALAVAVGGTPWLPVGRGLPGVTACVLDGARRPAPVGMAGEIHLAGPTLARGYHAAPAATAERFVPRPGGPPGSRWYATGDRGRLRADGAIEFLGRGDHQVKVRGFRVEPGEIEAALRACPGVRDAVVVARHDESGRPDRLAAFVLAEAGSSAAADVFRELLGLRLPDYMIPGSFTMVPEFPRTAAGKIDRRALADLAPLAEDRPYVEPRDELEREVASVLGEVLGVERVGAFDDFFALGGHSLLAARAGARLRVRLGRDVSVRDLLASPTVAAIASRVAARSRATTSALLAPVGREAYRVALDVFDPEPTTGPVAGSATGPVAGSASGARLGGEVAG